MPIYEKPPVEVREVCDAMLEKYHGPLKDAGVTIDLLFAKTDPEKDEAVALKHHGYRANAIVKVVPYKLRVQGHADAEIIVDGDEWFTWSDEEKDALFDHELEHLELKLDKEGLVCRDDLDRPKLKIRLHDHEFGWFDSIARRHGKHSFEVQQYERFQEAHRQMWLNYEHETEQPAEGVTVEFKGRGKRKFKDASEAADAIIDDCKKQFSKGSTRRAASRK